MKLSGRTPHLGAWTSHVQAFPLGLCLTLLLYLGSLGQAGEPATLCTTDEAVRMHLRAVAGTEVRIELCDLSDDYYLRNNDWKSGRRTILAVRGQVDPMLVERLRNFGHQIRYLEAPGRDRSATATCKLLEKLCTELSACFPKHADTFGARLAFLDREIRSKARQRTSSAAADFVQALQKASLLASSSS